ncbi:MAG: hypothetical protein FWE37_00670 [Spirochaetaceae bacterium]|nr:hypothetical protein [Spirochaetaceae bacterium]
MKPLFLWLILLISFNGYGLQLYFNDRLAHIYNTDELTTIAMTDEAGRQYITLNDIIPLGQNNPTVVINGSLRLGQLTAEQLMNEHLVVTNTIRLGRNNVIINRIDAYAELLNDNNLTVWLSSPQPVLQRQIENFGLLHRVNIKMVIVPNLATAIESLPLTGESPPDVIITTADNSFIYNYRDNFIPLSRAVLADEQRYGSFFRLAPSYLQAIAYPLLFSYQALLYNSDVMHHSLFDGAVPTVPSLHRAAAAVQNFVTTPIAWNVSGATAFLPFLRINGLNTSLQEENLRAAFNLGQSLFASPHIRNISGDINSREIALFFSDTGWAGTVNTGLVDLAFLALPQGMQPLFTYYVALSPIEAPASLAGQRLILSLWGNAGQFRVAAERGFYPNRLGQLMRPLHIGEREALEASLANGAMLSGVDGWQALLNRFTALFSLVMSGLITIDEAISNF